MCPVCPLCHPLSGAASLSSAPDVWWGPWGWAPLNNMHVPQLSFQGADAEARNFGGLSNIPSRGQVRMRTCFPGTCSHIPSGALESLGTARWREHERGFEDLPR